MTEWPTSITISPDGKAKLKSMLEYSYKKIYGELSTATSFGVANRQRLLVQIRQYLQELGVNLNDFTKDEIPKYYDTGSNQAILQLTKIGAEVPASIAYNQLSKQAVSALVSDMSSSFADSMQGVYRSTSRLINQATKDAVTQDISHGIISGKSIRKVKNDIVATLQDRGLTALVGSNGRNWSLDDYAQMLYRTKAVESRNLGMINQMAAGGYDLVQCSSHGATDQCGPWEGKILSTTGDTKEFQGETIYTVQDAIDDGLFHPNCKHAINAIAVDLALQTVAYTGKKDENGKPIYAKGSLTWTQDTRSKLGISI